MNLRDYELTSLQSSIPSHITSHYWFISKDINVGYEGRPPETSGEKMPSYLVFLKFLIISWTTAGDQGEIPWSSVKPADKENKQWERWQGCQKVWKLTKIFRLNIRYYVTNARFVLINELLEKFHRALNT